MGALRETVAFFLLESYAPARSHQLRERNAFARDCTLESRKWHNQFALTRPGSECRGFYRPRAAIWPGTSVLGEGAFSGPFSGWAGFRWAGLALASFKGLAGT